MSAIERAKNPAGLTLSFLIVLLIAAELKVNDGLSGFVSNYKTFIVVLILVATSILLFHGVRMIALGATSLVARRFQIRELEKRLSHLSPMEKFVLAQFVTDDKMQRALNPDEGAVAWLESIKVLTSCGTTADGRRKEYRISPFAMKVLSENRNWLH